MSSSEGRSKSVAMASRSSQREVAYGVIRRSILLGHTKHGTRINERVLAEKLGISRVPVREALLCLHGEGLISKSKRGLEVTRLSPEDILHQIEFRAIIECAAVRLASERITETETERLRELVAQQEILERAQDLDAFRESDLAFHQQILRATNNPFIIRMSGTLALGSIVSQASNNGVVSGHRAILDAIAQGNADQAEELMYAHITAGPFYLDDAQAPAEPDAEAGAETDDEEE